MAFWINCNTKYTCLFVVIQKKIWQFKKNYVQKNKCNRNDAQPVVCFQVEDTDRLPVPLFCECGIKHQWQTELNDSVKNSLVDSLLQKSLWEMFPSTTTELSLLQCCLPTSCKLTPHMWSNQYLALKQAQSVLKIKRLRRWLQCIAATGWWLSADSW